MRDVFPVKHDVIMPGKRTVGICGLQVSQDGTPARTAATAWAPVTGAGSVAGSTEFWGVGNVLAQSLQVSQRQMTVRPVGAW